MNSEKYESWIINLYKNRGWYELSPSRHENLLIEEIGEVARAIRIYEIGRDNPLDIKKSKKEELEDIGLELSDVLNQLVILSNLYDFSLNDLMSISEIKLSEKFGLK